MGDNTSKATVQTEADRERLRKKIVALVSMLHLLPAFKMEKKGDTVTLTATMPGHEKTIEVEAVFNLTEPLGEWLATLPKHVWAELEKTYGLQVSEATFFVQQ